MQKVASLLFQTLKNVFTNKNSKKFKAEQNTYVAVKAKFIKLYKNLYHESTNQQFQIVIFVIDVHFIKAIDKFSDKINNYESIYKL